MVEQAHSVMPQPDSTLKEKLAAAFCTRDGGIGAPAEAKMRNFDRSNFCTLGISTMSLRKGVAPMVKVQPCICINSTPTGASQRSSSTTSAPNIMGWRMAYRKPV